MIDCNHLKTQLNQSNSYLLFDKIILLEGKSANPIARFTCSQHMLYHAKDLRKSKNVEITILIVEGASHTHILDILEKGTNFQGKQQPQSSIITGQSKHSQHMLIPELYFQNKIIKTIKQKVHFLLTLSF